jgi:hypothetical protein
MRTSARKLNLKVYANQHDFVSDMILGLRDLYNFID